MGIFDSVTSWFSSSDVPQESADPASGELPVEVGPQWGPSTMLSNSYALKDFTVTSQALSQPNLPSSEFQMANLMVLADIKEQLDNLIGHSSILSGFRTKELQNVLASQGEPVASGTSFHEIGRGMDIAPVGMTPKEFFGRLLANEELKNKFSEIAIKPSQNSIHLAVNTVDDWRFPKILGLNNDGVYKALGVDDILTYISPYMPSLEAATNSADAAVGTNYTPMLIAVGLGIIGLTFLGKKRISGS